MNSVFSWKGTIQSVFKVLHPPGVARQGFVTSTIWQEICSRKDRPIIPLVNLGEEEEDEDDEPVHDLTGGGALLSLQPPAVTVAPRLHNASREVAIRMPRDKATNTGARGPNMPATVPGQASTRFCNLAEALLATGATFGNKTAKSVSSLKITKQVGGFSHTLGVARKQTVVQ